MVASRNAAGVYLPMPKPAANGTLPSIADSGAAPVTVRNSTPMRPTAFDCSFETSVLLDTSTVSSLAETSAMISPLSCGLCDWGVARRPAGRRHRIACRAEVGEELAGRHHVAIDVVDDLELVPVQLLGGRRAAILQHENREAFVGERAHRRGD